MRHGLLIVGALLVALPALAEDKAPFMTTEANWTIVAMGPGRCTALNRPLAEFNGSPFNAMWFTQKSGETDPQVAVFFWPEAYNDGDGVRIAIALENGKKTLLQGHAQGDFQVNLDAPLPADLLADMAESKSTEFNGGGRRDIMFDTTPLPNVLAKLKECMASLPPA